MKSPVPFGRKSVATTIGHSSTTPATNEPASVGRVVKRVPHGVIVVRRNPRIDALEQMRIDRMRDSILSRVGQIQAIVCRPLKADDPRRKNGAELELVAGLRRYRGNIAAGKADIEASIEEMDDARADDIAAAENAEREPLTVWSVMHECARRAAAGEDREDIARIMHIDMREVNDLVFIHDELAPELLAKVETSSSPDTMRRLFKCARACERPGLAKEQRYREQRKWWRDDLASRERGTVPKPRKPKRASPGSGARPRPSAKYVQAIAKAIDRDRQIRNPRTGTMMTLDGDTALAFAEALRHIAHPKDHPRPVP